MRRALHRFVLQVFGRIPWRLQRRLIGLVKPGYVAGSSAVVVGPDGRYLLVRHSYKGGWSTPGGFLNRGEQPDEAVAREVWEEVGLRVAPYDEPVAILRSADRIVEFVQRVRLIDEAAGAHVRPVSPEIDEVGWFDPEALPALSPITRKALAALAASDERRAAGGPRPPDPRE